MNQQSPITIQRTSYGREKCQIGIVHLGFGAFHRAHQSVYIDEYMELTGDLHWGIAAVNLREEDAEDFARHEVSESGYLLKTTSASGESKLREVRSHVRFEDWSRNYQAAVDLVSLPSVKIISLTITESGYYFNDHWSLDTLHSDIAEEIAGGCQCSVYAYLAAALRRRRETIDASVTILCCDNIRSNGERLKSCFKTYLELTGQIELVEWIDNHVTFPCSMVDKITPRATDALRDEIFALSPVHSGTAIHGESFSQWVLEENFASDFPALDKVGVEYVDDVDPYEEAKIRILNGGHTALCYIGALAGYRTFDEAMADPGLRQHFDLFQKNNVLPGLLLDLPFDKHDYLQLVANRFSNTAIADDLGRICMDGWSKFPIFIRPTLKSCLAQGINPKHGYESIASWYVYARHHMKGQTHITYVEPYWDQLEPLLGSGKEPEFAASVALWSDLPTSHEDFVPGVVSAIERMEEKWPI